MKKILVLLIFIISGNLVMTVLLYRLYPMPISIETDSPTSDYSLMIDEGERMEIEWKYRIYNKSLVEKVHQDTNMTLDLGIHDAGDSLIWKLSILDDSSYLSPDEDSYYWEILRDEYNNIDNEEQYVSSHKYRIDKLPSYYLTRMLNLGVYYTNKIIPIEVGDFISEMNDIAKENIIWYSDYSTYYTFGAHSMTKNYRNITNLKEQCSYNSDGILENQIISYENQTALQLELITYDIEEVEHQDPCYDQLYYVSFLFNLLFYSNIASIIILLIIIFNEKNPQDKNTLKSIPSKIAQNQLSPDKVKRDSIGVKYKYKKCPNCGTLLDHLSNFCHQCGLKIKNENSFCQYCGTPLLKTAKFCYNCGQGI
ncbi:MAG: zinc ribbon domain-containing protein [Promethearchaeota archaeon]|nr:MAG: zinc ribbon domain-containing protein [Candidatus Lokiarchaeota archaeon]